MTAFESQLHERIQTRTAQVGVVGLGYVGLPLAVEFARAGFSVDRHRPRRRKVAAIATGESYIPDVPSDDVAALVAAGRLRATTDFSIVRELDTINICVPTPLRKTKDPGHVVHRVGRRGDRAAPAPRACS